MPRGREDRRSPDSSGGDLATGRLEASWGPEAGRAGARPSGRTPDALQRAAQRIGPTDRLDEPNGRVLAEAVRRPRRPTEKDGPMTNAATETRSVVVERDIPYPPEKIWRALTQPHLIEEWLMKNDFKPMVGHSFKLRGGWGGVLNCEVLAVEPHKTLSYTWNHVHADAAYKQKT